jgi:CDP-6-deoxy-D-xylo-4-hexulose-3-dehydrase
MIRFGTLDFTEECQCAVANLVTEDDPQLSMGKYVHQFETEFAKWLGSRYAVLVNSGTSALMVALSAIKPMLIDEYKIKSVITSALTYPANWNAISFCGLKTKIEDVTDQYVMDAMSEKSLDVSTLLMPVHLLGKPCPNTDMFIPDIEDTCEALGSSIDGKKLGTFGLCGVFSFYISHQITTVEGGMVVTNNKELYENLLSARDNGRLCTCPICTLKVNGVCKKRQDSATDERRWAIGDVVGGNFKPTEFQGILGCVKMKTIDDNINRRNKIFLRYAEEFNTLRQESGEFIVPIAYPVKVKNPRQSVALLESVGIEARGMFPAYSPEFINASEISKTHILIPLHHKMSDEDVDKVIEEVKKLESL